MFGRAMNIIGTIIQFGNNEQKNTIIYEAKIDTTIKRLEKDFNEGNIQQACDDLNSLIDENSSNPKIKYQLLVKKVSFLFALGKYDNAFKLLENIEINYQDFLDISYEEIKLIELSLKKKEEDFFKLVGKIIAESSKELQESKFELIYYLNSKDIQKAIDIFEKLEESIQYSSKYSFLGGHIYSALNNHELANKLYTVSLDYKLSYLDKYMIKSYYASIIINKYMYGQKLPENYQEQLLDYYEITKKILEQEKHFDKNYIDTLKNSCLLALQILGKTEEYIELYEKYQKIDIVFNFHYLPYCYIKQIKIDHKIIQEKIKKSLDDNLLIQYSSLLTNKEVGLKDKIKVLKFLELNQNYIFGNKYILLFYIQTKTCFNKNIEKEYIDFLNEKKYEGIEYLLAYLHVANIVNKEEVNKLIYFANNEHQIFQRILDAINILNKLGYRKEYIDLAICKQIEFPIVILKTLEICINDKDLHNTDFEYFVENIENKDSNILSAISDIYYNFNLLKKSFIYLYQVYTNEKKDKNLLLRMIEISLKYYLKINDRINETQEREIFNELIANKNELILSDIIFLLQYSITVLQDTKQILPILNGILLDEDINSLEEEIKIDLSNIYSQIIAGITEDNFNQLFIYDDNICYIKDGKTYINNYYISENNQNSFGLIAVDKHQFISIKNDPQYEKSSLFHRIVGPFAFKVNNPNFTQIQLNMSSSNPLEDMMKKIHELFGDDKELFNRYSNQEFYGLYSLAKYNYINYFTLIPFLLHHKKYRLCSLRPNFIVDKKKIITLSSIIFLDEIGYLEKVLKMENIVIQQTTINWLNKIIDTYNISDRPQNYSYLNETKAKFIPRTKTTDERAMKFKNRLSDILSKIIKCEIIDDTNENLPIANSYDMLANEIGKQEYYAFAYCINHNYQIVSEDNIFEMLFDVMKYNKIFITNSLSLLTQCLNQKEILKLQKKLYKKRYLYVSNCPKINDILDALYYFDFKKIINSQLKILFKIWYEYGCLNNIIKMYEHKYKVLYPKVDIPKKDVFSKNIDYLLNEVIVND